MLKSNLYYFLYGMFVMSIIYVAIDFITESKNEEKYLINADCVGLEIYLDAAEEGRTLFAYWTSQTQDTINFRITSDNVEIAQEAYENRPC